MLTLQTELWVCLPESSRFQCFPIAVTPTLCVTCQTDGLIDLNQLQILSSQRFRESAIQLVTKHIPEPSLDALRAALQLAIQHALSRGVTTMVDMGRFPFSSSDPQSAWRDLELLMQPAADAGLLKARLVVFMPLSSW